MAQQPTYLIAPSFDYRENSGPIRLGSLIANPLKPHQILTSIDNTALDTRYPRVEETTHFNRCDQWGTGHSIAFSAGAYLRKKVSGGMSAEMSAALERHAMIELKTKVLVTKYFEADPSPAEIKVRIEDLAVDQVMVPWRKLGSLGRRYPVYMIIGLKIAKGGFDVKIGAGSKTAGAVEGSAVVVDGSLSGGEKTMGMHVWESGENIVVAYKLLKIKSERKGVAVEEFEHKAAMLSLGGLNHESPADEEDSDEEITMSMVTVADFERV